MSALRPLRDLNIYVATQIRYTVEPALLRANTAANSSTGRILAYGTRRPPIEMFGRLLQQRARHPNAEPARLVSCANKPERSAQVEFVAYDARRDNLPARISDRRLAFSQRPPSRPIATALLRALPGLIYYKWRKKARMFLP